MINLVGQWCNVDMKICSTHPYWTTPWRKLVKRELQYGDGQVKVYSVSGDMAKVAGNAMGILGLISMPVSALSVGCIQE